MTSTLRWYFLTQNAERAQTLLARLRSQAAYQVLNEVEPASTTDSSGSLPGHRVFSGDARERDSRGNGSDALPIKCVGDSVMSGVRGGTTGTRIMADTHTVRTKKSGENDERGSARSEHSALLVAPPWFGAQLEDVCALLSAEGHSRPEVRLVVGLAPELSAADTLAWKVACGARAALHVQEDGSAYALGALPAAEQPRAAAQVAQIRALFRLQQRLATEVARVEELSEQRRAFLRNVSHELATPLTPIVGYVTLLLKEDLGPLTDIQRKAIEGMRSAATRLRSVVDSLLDVSALETSHLHFYDRVYDFADIVKRCVAERRPEAERRRIALRLDLSEGPLRARGDQGKLSRACGHLLDNALKFTPDGGEVAVESGVLGETRGDEMLFIAISDSGGGIDPKKLARVTDPMVQADGSVTRLHGGAGLGLAFARRVAEGLGGTLSVESPPAQAVAGRLLSGTRVELCVATLAQRSALTSATDVHHVASRDTSVDAGGSPGSREVSFERSGSSSGLGGRPRSESE